MIGERSAGRTGGSKMKQFLRNLAVSLFATLISLAIFEMMTRSIFHEHIAFLEDVDHRMLPDGDEINEDGVRAPPPGSFQEDDTNIIFLGDSFTFGLGVPANLAFPYQFEQIIQQRKPELRVKVADFGWTGSSPLLSYRLLQDIGAHYHPDLVILAIDMTDFHDDLMFRLYLEKPGIYKWAKIAPGSFFAIKRIIKGLTTDSEFFYKLYTDIYHLPPDLFFITNHPLTMTRPFTRDLERNLSDINGYCRDVLHADFMVVVLPRHYQYSDRECPGNWEASEYKPLGFYVREPFAWFDSLAQEVSYPIHSLLPAFEHSDEYPLYFPDDPHFTPKGHSIAAWAVLLACLQEGYLK